MQQVDVTQKITSKPWGFGDTILMVSFIGFVSLIVGLYNSDTNRSLQPVGVFKFGVKANMPDCNKRTDCPAPMVTAEDVANGYIRQLPPRQPIFEREL